MSATAASVATTAPAPPPVIDAGVCERLVNTALDRCAAVPPPPAPTGNTADLLSGVAISISLATGALAVLTILGAIGWMFYVRHRTKVEAKSEVEKIAPGEVKAYLDAHVAGMVAEAVAALSSNVNGGGLTPEEQAEALSKDEEPR